MTGFLRIGVALALLCGLALAGCGRDEPKSAKAGAGQPAGRKPGETNVAGVSAEFLEAKRRDGVLTVQVRFTNAGEKAVSFYPVSGGKFDTYYVTAEDKKYLVLRDEANTPLAPQVNPGGDVYVSLQPGQSWTWWAKYPAPPPAVKTMSYHTSITPPFDGVAITDG